MEVSQEPEKLQSDGMPATWHPTFRM